MQRTFVRNAVNFAVNFCKKCGEMWRIIFFSPHSPLSPHFLHYFATKLDALNFCKKCGEFCSEFL